MNPLGQLIARRIVASGPIDLAEFMALALGHPQHGYYMTRDPLGQAGDFITAPEISQVFGELIGLWCVEVWRAMGSPTAVNLVELGPGRGTLMADALRAAALVPDFICAARLHLVETSPVLRVAQRGTLAGRDVAWHDGFDGVPNGPLLLVANEFFDALPVRQLQRSPEGWRERLVDCDGDGFRIVLSAPDAPAAALLAPAVRDGAPIGAVAEIHPAGLRLVDTVVRRIENHGGAALIVDYGYETSTAGDTLQALRRHKPQGVLADPGEADLTVHVDFDALVRAAGPRVRPFGPVPQGDFLRRLGAGIRAEQLSAKAAPERAANIRSGVARLIEPAEMGTLFKVLALMSRDLPAPPGFEP